MYEPKATELEVSLLKCGEMLVNAVGCHDCHSLKK